ncbi:MAG: hypothetical protein L0Y35_07925, partial [Flammeovirgaceae bacterium]|nr:hypothetical protein [Flammeovirgaceae bacterium]
ASNRIMSYQSIVTRLFFILVSSDGSISDKEVSMSKKMVEVEGFDPHLFQVEINLLKTIERSRIFDDSVNALRELNTNQQLRAIAWLCVLANADGFMDKAEWQFIYRLYNIELGLMLSDLMDVQKQLSTLSRKSAAVVTVL